MSRHVSVIASLACNYVATACQIVCGLAIVPIAIRHLGEDGYGTWLGLTALAAVGGFADMGVSWVLVPWFGIVGLAAGLVARAVVGFVPLCIYNLAFLARSHADGHVGLDLARCRSFAMLGGTSLAVRWIQSVLAGFDILCVSTTHGPGAATLYANTARPTGMATGLANAFGGALLPAFTRFLAREQGATAFRLFLNTLRLTMIMAGALAISFMSVRRQFVAAWVGSHFILPIPLSLAIATAAIASTTLAFASYMYGSTGRLVQSHGLLFVEGAVRIALMACGAYLFGSLGLAVAATPTPLIATILLLVGMARFTGVRIHAAEWLALAVDVALILAGLAAASMLPAVPLRVWQIPLVAAGYGGLALLVLTLRSAPLRQMLREAAHAVLPAGVRRVLPSAASGVQA